MIQPGTDDDVTALISTLVRIDDLKFKRDLLAAAVLKRHSTRDLAKVCGVSHQTIARWGRAAV